MMRGMPDEFALWSAARSGVLAPGPRRAGGISSLLIKPASALCNLDCSYCFYLDRETDPYRELAVRRMGEAVQERMVRTYLEYAYPMAVFAFQGGEPTLAGLPYFERMVEMEVRYARRGHTISNALQTNGTLVDDDWAKFFAANRWLIGLSLDGPQEVHDAYRVNKAGHGTWAKVMQALETMQRHGVEFNILCVLSQANVGRARELYEFFRSLKVGHVQYIPLAEFQPDGSKSEFAITPEQYGEFLVQTFELWWPDRRTMRIRCFDNLAEALAGHPPGTCTLQKTCDTYAVVEYNGDVYPCDFFVEERWKLGNLMEDTWTAMANRPRRYEFAHKKAIPHPECQACEYYALCRGGCPKFREGARGRFEELDYFCEAYKKMFRHAAEPLRRDLAELYRGKGN